MPESGDLLRFEAAYLLLFHRSLNDLEASRDAGWL
jgi:hypothetical protein